MLELCRILILKVHTILDGEDLYRKKAIRKNAFQRNSQNTSSKAKNSFFKRKWESILQNADLLSREMNGGIMVFATYPECTSAKAYMSPAFKENVPGFKISELKRLNDCYLVSANGDTQMHLAAGRDTLVTLMHENNATRRNIISNFDQMHKAQAGMAEKMEVIVQCLEDKVEALEERVLLQLKEIEDKLQLLPAPEHRISNNSSYMSSPRRSTRNTSQRSRSSASVSPAKRRRLSLTARGRIGLVILDDSVNIDICI
ncbi:hypothetical protein BC829DRAFT_419350 [Chytridium lagenaria]|nr:hypothetical protein BC829DRAFT_419350 [Chytridium lagenaria]